MKSKLFPRLCFRCHGDCSRTKSDTNPNLYSQIGTASDLTDGVYFNSVREGFGYEHPQIAPVCRRGN